MALMKIPTYAGGGGEVNAIPVDTTYSGTMNDTQGKSFVLDNNTIKMNVSVPYGHIGNMDVRQFSSMTAQHVSGYGLGIYAVSSMSETSGGTTLAITWGDTAEHNINLSGVDYIRFWGDSGSATGTGVLTFTI